MNDEHFDAWTRRRFGLAGGGILAALAQGDDPRDVAALAARDNPKQKKRRRRAKNRKKRCLDVRQRCRPGEATRHCCAGLSCDETITLDGLARRCCRQVEETCEDVSDCCYPATCDEVDGLPGRHCCREAQRPCTSAGQCCGDLSCRDATGLDGTRCCAELGFPCQVDSDCCSFAYCNGVTLSCKSVS